MNVINLSLGEPEVEPSRDLVVQAIEGAAAAGVVPVVAAGNDFDDFGYGSVSLARERARRDHRRRGRPRATRSPTSRRPGRRRSRSQMKPDVAAPGVDVLSSLPPSQGPWGTLSGTSMAAPHVAGAAALLKERHPDWTVAQIKSALVQTGDPVRSDGRELLDDREGGGVVDLPRADVPLLFAVPDRALVRRTRARRASRRAPSRSTDAGGGAGDWTVTAVVQSGSGSVTVPADRDRPGRRSP